MSAQNTLFCLTKTNFICQTIVACISGAQVGMVHKIKNSTKSRDTASEVSNTADEFDASLYICMMNHADFDSPEFNLMRIHLRIRKLLLS